MEKEEILKIIMQQKNLIKSISSIANDILYTIESSVTGDKNAINKMVEINDKNSNIVPTFIKVSDLLFKTFLMEHKLTGSVLNQKVEPISEDNNDDEYQLSEEDITIIKHYINNLAVGEEDEKII